MLRFAMAMWIYCWLEQGDHPWKGNTVFCRQKENWAAQVFRIHHWKQKSDTEVKETRKELCSRQRKSQVESSRLHPPFSLSLQVSCFLLNPESHMRRTDFSRRANLVYSLQRYLHYSFPSKLFHPALKEKAYFHLNPWYPFVSEHSGGIAPLNGRQPQAPPHFWHLFM